MLALPTEVICGGILPHLSVCDLQALDTAYTNKCLRPQLRQVWKCYHYDSANAMLKVDEVSWLRGIDTRIISLIVNDATIITTIPTLKKLHVKAYVHSTVLESFAVICPDLEELRVYYIYGPNTDDAFSVLAQNCRQLHTLRLSDCELTDAGISSLAQYGNQLHTLHISAAPITDAGIQALCDNCPYLKHIGLSYCDNLTDASLIAITNSYSHVESISLHSYNFTDDGLIYFADKCHELRSVSVRCKNITNRGLTALWVANTNIVDIDIICNSLVAVDDIIQLVQCCPLLQKLNISYCWNTTDAPVIAVAEHCPQLRSLDISGCFMISDDLLVALGQHCHQLKSINISYLWNISDMGLAALAAGCPLLQEFYARCTTITDDGVIALARGCRDLHKIDMTRCKSIGIGAVSAFAKNCPLMSELFLQDCEHVDNACIYVIAQHCRNLTCLTTFRTNVSDIAALKSCLMRR